MAKVISHYNSFSTATITGSGGSWILPSSVLLYVDTGAAVSEDNTHADNAIRIDGRAFSLDSYGLQSLGASSDITVTATGAIAGATAGIFTGGANESITNAGSIDGRTDGIRSEGESLLIDNSGAIGGSIGVEFVNFGGDVLNRAGGIISGDTAITASTTEGERIKVVNDGLIIGSIAAYSSTLQGIDIIINRGRIKGDIALGDGNDIFNNDGGKLIGEVSGGAGNDTYTVNKQSTHIIENVNDAGTDTVNSTVSYTLGTGFENLLLLGTGNNDGIGNGAANVLTGNLGQNDLDGKGGADTLIGGAGNDSLTGGTGADLFVFRSGCGQDTITDFNKAADHIDLTGIKNLDSFSDLKLNHIVVADDHISIVVGADEIILMGVAKSDLTRDQFDI